MTERMGSKGARGKGTANVQDKVGQPLSGRDESIAATRDSHRPKAETKAHVGHVGTATVRGSEHIRGAWNRTATVQDRGGQPPSGEGMRRTGTATVQNRK